MELIRVREYHEQSSGETVSLDENDPATAQRLASGEIRPADDQADGDAGQQGQDNTGGE